MNLFDFVYDEVEIKLENEKEKEKEDGKSTTASGLAANPRQPKRQSVSRSNKTNIRSKTSIKSLFDEDYREIYQGIYGHREEEYERTNLSSNNTDAQRVSGTRQRGGVQDERSRNSGYGNTGNERNSSVRGIEQNVYLDFKANEEIFITGAKDKYNKNIKAINIVKELEGQNRQATKEEQTALNLYTGWGGIPQVFDITNENWKKEYEELKNTLSKEEYEAAFLSTQDSHYTPKLIIDTIYKALNHFGFNNTDDIKDILEPSAGNGAFLSFRNSKNYNFECVEKDKISSDILKHMYPNQTIVHGGFEEYTPPFAFDAVIGNPPYGQKKIFDANNSEISMQSVHNYFLTRSLNELKDGGIGAFVVSSFVMDAKNSQAREYINKHGSFLGAVRLPNNMFKNKAGTEVTTDIIFFQKGKKEKLQQSWSEVKEYDQDININEYFINNPQNILGNMQRVMSGIGEQTQCIAKDNLNLENELNKFISSLPKDIFTYKEREQNEKYLSIKKSEMDQDEYEKLSKKKVETFCIINNEIYMKINSSESDTLSFQKPELSELNKKRIIKINEIRNALNELIALEQKDIKDDNPNLINQRQKLNNLYDNFVKNEGFLNKPANKKAFEDDVEARKILALEINYDKGISKSVAAKEHILPKQPSAKKADIFSKRTISPNIKPAITNSQEALSASLNQFGNVNMEYMSMQLDKPKKEIAHELINKKLIFLNPLTAGNNYKEYILANKYLSGNVKKKLEEIESLLKDYPNEFAQNYEALKEIQPKDLRADEIHVNLGTSWIPLEYYSKFFEEHFQTSRDNFNLNFNVKTGEWNFSGKGYMIDRATISKYSTERIDIYSLSEHALKRKTLIIQDRVLAKDSNGNQLYNDKGEEKYKYITNHEETTKANAKLEKLKSEFKDWIYKDYDRRTHLEKIYNDTFNTDVIPKYDGSHLQLSGLNMKFNLRPHQKNAIWRAINEQSVLMDHQVGAGKTLVAIGSVMEQKRMGLVNKPLIVVPNHLLSQWSNEFYQAYPNANILVANKKDLEKNAREQFFGKIATNSYDAVIMTHSQFKLLPSPFKILKEQMEEDIQILKDILYDQEQAAKENGNSRNFSVKQTAKKVENLEVKLNDLIQANKKSKALDFSELGIDALIVDESHEYKNLLITTSMGNIAGLGSINGSQKSYDMISKTRYMHNNGYKINFLSGTPISNSITELYTLQRYLQPKTLEEKGIQSFDAWASTFAQTKASWELDTSANNYKLVTRLNEFVGLPELTKMYRSFADTVTNTDIKKINGDFLPKLYNDKPINEISERSGEIAEFIGIQDENGRWNHGSIIYRMEHFEEDPRQNNMLACTTDARKAGLDYRLVNPSANDYEGSKVNTLADNVFNEWKNWGEEKGTQLVFCDLSVPKINSQSVDIGVEKMRNEDNFFNINDSISVGEEEKQLTNDEIIATSSKFDIYSDLLKKLVNKGVPQEEIRFIHDATTDLQKAKLFADVNEGKVRVLIGSTSKMGAGTNVQQRAVAIHHADCPWRPSDLEQRNGRVIRQGNKLFEKDPTNFRIKEYRYATQKTYDARMWQVIEQKAQAIEQFRMGGIEKRSMEDVSMGSADASEMKAEATGNSFILLQVQLANELKEEEALYNSFHSDIYRNENALKNSISQVEYSKKEIKRLENIKEHLANNESENFTCKAYVYSPTQGTYTSDFTIYKNDNSESNKLNQQALKERFEKNISLLASKINKEMPLFEYRGLKISGERVDVKRVEFYLENKEKNILITPQNLVYEAQNSMSINFSKDISLSGFFTRVNNYLNNLDNHISKEKINIQIESKNITALEKVTGENTPKYTKKDYLEALRTDNYEILQEIKKLSDDKNYKSSWKPKSQKIKNQEELHVRKIFKPKTKQTKQKELDFDR